jgi:drug/metabolite transporter (DMT)-like permease
MKKGLGIFLIVLGALALVFDGINYTSEETIIDAGPLQVSADTKKTLNWPTYAGAILAVAGVIILVAGNKNK